jgi:hypothetical protein
MPLPVAGGKVRAQDILDLAGRFVRKTATESIVSSTTLQDDDELLFSVEADTTYRIELMLFYDGATGGDLKVKFTLPAGASFDFGHMGPELGIAGGDGNTVDNRRITDSDTLGVGCAGAGTLLVLPIYGVLTVGATAGIFRLQWAQFTSNAGATKVFPGSYLLVRKMVLA